MITHAQNGANNLANQKENVIPSLGELKVA